MAALFNWIPAVLCAAIIFSLSHLSHPPGLDLGPNHLLHLLEYSVFASTLLWGGSERFQKILSARQLLWFWLLGAVYAMSDEMHQFFVPNRDASFSDVLADVAGVTLVILVYRLRRSRLQS